jgi:nitroreductase
MEYFELIKERYSVRKFDSRKVKDGDLEKILNAGNLAPTGCNNQPQRIYVLKSEEAIEKLKGCTRSHFDAPNALIVCYDKTLVWRRKYDGKSCGVADASIVTTHLMLAAHDIGVGTTWVMSFDPKALVEAFDIPENIVPVAILVMGYPHIDAKPADMHYACKPLIDTVIYK